MNSFRLAILITALACFCISVYALKNDFTAEKWQVIDIPVKYQGETNNPLTLQMGATILHEGGTQVNVPGFYNDKDTWIIRFCPSIEGRWIYKTYSTIPDMAGKTGIIEVSANTKLDEHGPVLISKDDPQKFVYADGTPYFLMAFELDWLFALDWDNKNDIPKTKRIISRLSEYKFNQVVMNVYAYDAGWGDRDAIRPEHNYAKPEVFPFGGTNEQPDYSVLNIDFFKHLDRVIAHLDDEEIIAHLMIYVWNKKVNWPEPNSTADNMYFDYVVKRYQAYPNLIWDISKEALAYGRDDMSYITERINRLRKLDGHQRLLSVHDYAYCSAFPGKVDFISIQNWSPNIYDIMRNVLNKYPNKPIFNIEHGGYEKTMHSIFDGAYTDPIVCLDRNYRCIFAGTYSTYYWQNSSWYEVVYNPFELPDEQQPHFHYYQHLVNLFEEYNFNELQPAQSNFTTFMLTDSKNIYLFYLTEGMISVSGNVSGLEGKRFAVKWYDPFTGKLHSDSEKQFGSGSWISLRRNKNLTGPMAIAILEKI